jgi:hypothetical protein
MTDVKGSAWTLSNLTAIPKGIGMCATEKRFAIEMETGLVNGYFASGLVLIVQPLQLQSKLDSLKQQSVARATRLDPVSDEADALRLGVVEVVHDELSEHNSPRHTLISAEPRNHASIKSAQDVVV